MIAAIFAVVALWTNPLTLLLAIPFLGGRQLGPGKPVVKMSAFFNPAGEKLGNNSCVRSFAGMRSSAVFSSINRSGKRS